MRVGHDLRHAGRKAGIARKLPVKLRPKVQATRQARRSGFVKTRAQGVVLGRRRVRAIVFVVQHRGRKPPIRRHKHARGAMRAAGDGVYALGRLKVAQAVQKEGPDALGIEMWIGWAGLHRIGAA